MIGDDELYDTFGITDEHEPRLTIKDKQIFIDGVLVGANVLGVNLEMTPDGDYVQLITRQEFLTENVEVDLNAEVSWQDACK